MRSLKFRAWGGATNEHPAKMVYDIENETGYGGECFGDYLDPSMGWNVMQFTGLHDKNGREVFEGDVLKIDGGGDIIPVVVSFKYASFGITWPEGNFAELKYYFDMPFCDVEVLGNIYENPELLKELSENE